MSAILLLFVTLFACLLATPIISGDTDLWYHLTGGRYLFEQGTLYNPYINSFIEPTKDFTNYFWGFQLLAWLTFEGFGATGLIVLRTIVVMLTAYFVFRTLTAGASVYRVPWLTLATAIVCVFLVSERGTDIRPHFFSFLFVALFLFVLTRKQSWIPVLPFLAIAWVNLHGITWVLGAVICGGYILQLLTTGKIKTEQRNAVYVLVCLPVLMLNPNGYLVFLAPFAVNNLANLYITELYPPGFSLVLDLSQGLTWQAAPMLLTPVWLIGAARVLQDIRSNTLTLVCALAGLVLLFTATRFLWEWMLLSLPLFALAFETRPTQESATSFSIALLALALFVYSKMTDAADRIDRFPFDEASVPLATTDLIEQLEINGRYLLPPSQAGYIEWRLSPDLLIHSDMQHPPFDEADFAEAIAYSRHAAGFTNITQKYQPDLVAVTADNAAFRNIVTDRYRPIGFDGKLVLYIDAARYPDIARTHALVHINPFNVMGEVSPKALPLVIGELQRVIGNNPSNTHARIALAKYLMDTGALDRAASELASLPAQFADSRPARFLKAQIAQRAGRYPEAIAQYLTLLVQANPAERIDLNLAECYFRNNQPAMAVKHFSHSVNPYQHNSFEAHHLYMYAVSLAVSGERHKAIRMAEMFMNNYQADHELVPAVTKLLEDLNGGTP